MKKIILIIIVFNLSIKGLSQKIIDVAGKKIQMQTVDSEKFDIKGVWKIVDQRYFYDNGDFSKTKWDSLDNGNLVFISDSIFYACTNSLYCNLIINPIFIKSIDTTFSEGGAFFEQFNDTALHVSIWAKGDLLSSKNIEAAIATYEIYVLNKNYIIIIENNSFRYLERVNVANEVNGNGWRQENGYEVVEYNEARNDIRIKIDEKKINNKTGFLEYIFIPQKDASDATLKIFTLSNEELQNTKSSTLLIQKIDDPMHKEIKGHIPFSEFKTSVFSIFQGNKYYNGSAGKFLWRIVPDTTTN